MGFWGLSTKVLALRIPLSWYGDDPVTWWGWHLRGGVSLGPVLVWQVLRGFRSSMCELSHAVLAGTT